jgi:hypothetical protein
MINLPLFILATMTMLAMWIWYNNVMRPPK